MAMNQTMQGALGKLAVVVMMLFTFAPGLQARPNLKQVRLAVSMLTTIPQSAQKMVWANGGITLKEMTTILQTLVPDTYQALLDSPLAKDVEENKAEYVLGLEIEKSWSGKIFALDTPTARKYFWREAPDIRAIVDEIVFSDSLIKKLQWEHGGLSNYRIMQNIQMTHPDVYDLYVQATDDKNDRWLRSIIAGRIHSNKGKEKLGAIFTKRMLDHTGKKISVYYKGIEEPSVETWLLMTILHTRDLMAAMQTTGATMDDIVAAFRSSDVRAKFYHLYTHAYKGSPILAANAPAEAGITSASDYSRRRERGLRSVLGKTMREMESIVSEKRDGKTYYRFADGSAMGKKEIAEILAF